MPDEGQAHEFEEWTTRNKKTVRVIYGGAIGAFAFFVAYHFGSMALADGNLTLVEAALAACVVFSRLHAHKDMRCTF